MRVVRLVYVSIHSRPLRRLTPLSIPPRAESATFSGARIVVSNIGNPPDLPGILTKEF